MKQHKVILEEKSALNVHACGRARARTHIHIHTHVE